MVREGKRRDLFRSPSLKATKKIQKEALEMGMKRGIEDLFEEDGMERFCTLVQTQTAEEDRRGWGPIEQVSLFPRD